MERVEVLKGANAMLYGNTAAGGIINMVTKKPRFQTGGSFSLSGGSWNTYKPTFDVYGPISKDVAFRLNGTYETAKVSIMYLLKRSTLIHPYYSILEKITANRRR